VPDGHGSDPVISIVDLSKRFGGPEGVHAIDNVSLGIRDGEFVSLLGPSGCGKSTLLRILAGLIPYEQGCVVANGTEITAPIDEIGMMFQTANLLPWRNVEQNLKLGIETLPSPPDNLQGRLDGMLETIGLTQFRKHYPHELSGGMRQRVALGQALIRDPEILLMDEPFGALDALTRDRLNVELLRIWQKQRKTVLLVTHSIVEAAFLSDRVIVLSDRPAQVVEEVTIDLPRPRQPKETRESKLFSDYVIRLSQLVGVL
jgi:NitT/TauT family transport system ATP-binding protein